MAVLQALLQGSTAQDKIIFSGPIDARQVDNQTILHPDMTLTGTIDASVTLPPFQISDPRVSIELTTDEDKNQFCWLYFIVTLKISDQLSLDFKTALLRNSSSFLFAITPSTGTTVTADDISQLIFGKDFTQSIPDILRNIFKEIGLSGFTTSFYLPSSQVGESTGETSTGLQIDSVSVAVGASEPWQMGEFSLDNMVLRYTVLNPFAEQSLDLYFFEASFEFYPEIFTGMFNVEISADSTGEQLSIGAAYQGEVSLVDLIKGISGGKIKIPAEFFDMTFYDFGISFTQNDPNYDYVFYGNSDLSFKLPLVGGRVESNFHVHIQSVNDQKSYGLKGGLSIGDSYFTASLDLGEQDKPQILVASWEALNEDYLEINDITGALGLSFPKIPSELDLGLKSATFLYDFKKATIVFEAESVTYGKANFVAFKNSDEKWQYFSGFAVGHDINLSNLPLINQVFSEQHRLAIEHIQIVISSDAIDEESTARINALIAAGYPKVGSDGLAEGVRISVDLNLGGNVVPLSVSTGDGPEPEVENKDLVHRNRNALALRSEESGSRAQELAADGTLWYKIQQKFGPVIFEQIGIKYRKGRIWFALNTSLSTSGLTLELLNVAVGTPLDNFNPKFSIDGIGMDYENPSLTIEGTFLEIPGAGFTNFGGGAIFKAKTFSLDAMGSYAQFDDQVSLFVFAQVNEPFGGPPAFFVTGILGGFGYNSKLRIPDLDELSKLPLINGLDDPDNIGGKKATPIQALKTLIAGDGTEKPWVTSSAGNIWMAAGIKFASFELIHSTALMVGQFGKEFSLALLGISKGRFPKKGKEIYAYAGMDLRAYFAPSEGEISFSAVLSSSSFVLDKACHVTGGFAMYFWFGNHEHAGDFVMTLGGYSPYFSAPKWYPKIPRVGINWSIDSHVSITGGGYFAITPSAAMAGGALDLQFHAGNLKAWLTAHADIVIWWNPFYFIIDVGVTVGASYKISLFQHSKTFSVELGCNLGLWGPSTGGKVKVHWFVISFTISFGAKKRGGLDSLTWDQFREILPEKQDVVKITPVTGLAPKPVKTDAAAVLSRTDGTEDNNEKWLVRPDKLEFTTDSKVPCYRLYVGEKSESHFRENNDKINIRPMGKTGLVSSQRVFVKREANDGNWEEVDMQNKKWTIEASVVNVANSLWGTDSVASLSPGDDQLIKDQYTGFKLSAPSPTLSQGPGNISKEDLGYAPLKPGENPLQSGLLPRGPIPEKNAQAAEDIRNIMGEVKNKRDALHDALGNIGTNPVSNDDLSVLAEKAGAYFTNAPLEV